MEYLRGERDQKQEKAERSEKWEEVERAAKLAERRTSAAETQRYSTLPAELEGNTNFDWDEPPSYEQSFGNNQRNVHTSVLGAFIPVSHFERAEESNESVVIQTMEELACSSTAMDETLPLYHHYLSTSLVRSK